MIDRSTALDLWRDWRVSIILLPLCIYSVVEREDYGLLDNADLLVHEAGHFFFGFFGQFIRVAGGTLMQIALPSLLVWHFLRHSYRTGAQISMYWLGHNFLNISVYAADARARLLPLLGGNRSGHDWHYLLGRTGLLEHDDVVGYFFVALAILTFLLLLIMPWFVQQKEQP
ncbi:MAG: hypothetical protein R3282_07615 [Rhodothermales bacterium]|nr:hypothetical protein [Rhodothermales bacterium]